MEDLFYEIKVSWDPYYAIKKYNSAKINSIGYGSSIRVPEVRCELDSNADQCVVSSKTALIVANYNRSTVVQGYEGENGESETCETATGQWPGPLLAIDDDNRTDAASGGLTTPTGKSPAHN